LEVKKILKKNKLSGKESLLAIIKQSFNQHPYVSVPVLRKLLEQNKNKIKPATINRYLVIFKQDGVIYGAGRGWYSSISKPYPLDVLSIEKVVFEIEKKYPLLDFTCWSTEQISSYGHHLLSKYVTFLYTDRDSMPSVYEFLVEKGYDVHLNPSKVEGKNFIIRSNTIVIRPSISTQPAVGHFVKIEGLLVELFLESIDLNLIDYEEYLKTFDNVIQQFRISMALFLDYAQERKSDAIIQLIESIKAEFSINSPLIDFTKSK